MHRRAGRRRHHADGLRKERQRLLPLIVKKSFLLQLFLQLFIGLHETANTFRPQCLHLELVIPILLIDGNGTIGKDLLTVFGKERKFGCIPPKHDAPQSSILIFQGKIAVAGLVPFEIRNFTENHYIMQLLPGFQQALDIMVHFSDRIGILLHRIPLSRRNKRITLSCSITQWD